MYVGCLDAAVTVGCCNADGMDLIFELKGSWGEELADVL